MFSTAVAQIWSFHNHRHMKKPWIRLIWSSSSVVQPQACSNHPVNCCGFLFTWQGLRLQGSGSAGEAKAGYSLNTLPNVTNSSAGFNKTVCNRKSFRGKNKGCHYPQNHNHFTTMFFFRFHVLDNQKKLALPRKYLHLFCLQCFLVRVPAWFSWCHL